MGRLAAEEVRGVLRALVDLDVDLARRVAAGDNEIDALYHQIFSEVLELMRQDPVNVDRGTRILFAAKNLERIGDRVTNIAEDVVFLTPGHPPMRGRDGFQTAFQAALKRFRIDPVSEVQEIQIAGDLAYCWTYITVTMTPINGGAAARRSGDTLTILRKQAGGAWMIARDANMLTAAA